MPFVAADDRLTPSRSTTVMPVEINQPPTPPATANTRGNHDQAQTGRVGRPRHGTQQIRRRPNRPTRCTDREQYGLGRSPAAPEPPRRPLAGLAVLS